MQMHGENERSSSYQPFSSGSHDGASHEDNGNALCPCHSYHHNSDEASVKPMKCNWDIELLEFLLESFFCLFVEQDCCQVPSQQHQQQQQHPHHPHYPRDYRQQEQHDYRQQEEQQQQQQQLPSQEGPPKDDDDDSYFFEGQPSSIKQGQAGDDDDGKQRAKHQPQNDREAQDGIHMNTTSTCYDGCSVCALPQ